MKNVYDNSDFFGEYQSMRTKEVNANNLIEIPIMKELLPDLTDKTILDLGCGEGGMSKYFITKGAKHVTAIDISKNMIKEAKKLNPSPKIDYLVLEMEKIDTLKKKYDIVFSSLAFHYVKDFYKLISDIYKLLKKDGLLIYSQESPINTCPVITDEKQKNKIEIDGKTYHLLSDYCNEGAREVFWNGISVTKYHRSYATIVNTLTQNKFKILDIKDSYASKKAIELCPKYVGQKDKPYFTFVRAKKCN